MNFEEMIPYLKKGFKIKVSSQIDDSFLFYKLDPLHCIDAIYIKKEGEQPEIFYGFIHLLHDEFVLYRGE